MQNQICLPPLVNEPSDPNIVLSICMATYNRAAYIGETLDVILGQMTQGMELVVVDGASSDDTAQVVGRYAAKHPSLRYYRESTNSGIDGDFDKAVSYARGAHCWLMSDDDLLVSGALAAVLARIRMDVDLVVVNAEVRSKDLSVQLRGGLLPAGTQTSYTLESRNEFLAQTGQYLTFIGAVVIRRAAWLERAREPYYGTLFIHAGVIFQAPPFDRIQVILEPLIVIRYGNAMWTARGFEIWMYKWPQLVWSFSEYAESAKRQVTSSQPDASPVQLAWFRAIGAYTATQYLTFVSKQPDARVRWVARGIAALPATLLNAAFAMACYVRSSDAKRMNLYDLARSSSNSWVARQLARRLGVPVERPALN